MQGVCDCVGFCLEITCNHVFQLLNGWMDYVSFCYVCVMTLSVVWTGAVFKSTTHRFADGIHLDTPAATEYDVAPVHTAGMHICGLFTNSTLHAFQF